jgi:FMN phosphatase YigB (HAD superfamily)
LCFDVDNTLYPRSSNLGKAMGDRIVHWVRENVDLESIDVASLPPAKEVEGSFNHPPDICATDEIVERLCLHYYLQYGLTIVGLLKGARSKKHGGPLTDADEQSYLDEVHAPSQQLELFMPHPHEHAATRGLLAALKSEGFPLFLFSNAHADHVWRVAEHLGLERGLFEDLLHYYTLRANCKPRARAYEMMMALIASKYPDVAPGDVLFFDDAKVNLKAAKEFGFGTVLVAGENVGAHHEEAYIDYVIDDVRSTAAMREIIHGFCQTKPPKT